MGAVSLQRMKWRIHEYRLLDLGGSTNELIDDNVAVEASQFLVILLLFSLFFNIIYSFYVL